MNDAITVHGATDADAEKAGKHGHALVHLRDGVALVVASANANTSGKATRVVLQTITRVLREGEDELPARIERAFREADAAVPAALGSLAAGSGGCSVIVAGLADELVHLGWAGANVAIHLSGTHRLRATEPSEGAVGSLPSTLAYQTGAEPWVLSPADRVVLASHSLVETLSERSLVQLVAFGSPRKCAESVLHRAEATGGLVVAAFQDPDVETLVEGVRIDSERPTDPNAPIRLASPATATPAPPMAKPPSAPSAPPPPSGSLQTQVVVAGVALGAIALIGLVVAGLIVAFGL